VGVINIPIIHYSVEWWSTLHQGPTIAKLDNPSITLAMLWPLMAMIVGFLLYCLAAITQRVRGEVLEREYHARWVRDILSAVPAARAAP
jgi:heme exporter protein C